MTESEWEQLRAYLEHSCLTFDDVILACSTYVRPDEIGGLSPKCGAV